MFHSLIYLFNEVRNNSTKIISRNSLYQKKQFNAKRIIKFSSKKTVIKRLVMNYSVLKTMQTSSQWAFPTTINISQKAKTDITNTRNNYTLEGQLSKKKHLNFKTTNNNFTIKVNSQPEAERHHRAVSRRVLASCQEIRNQLLLRLSHRWTTPEWR